jgi:SnoaL-like protein
MFHSMDRDWALTALLDREQIRELATRYSFAADSRDFDAVAELFDEDVDNGRWGKGRAATKAFYENLLGRGADGFVTHFVSNHQIDFVDDSHAWGMCYVRAVAGLGDGWTEVIACYVDDYVKRADRWYFARRRPADLQRFTITDAPVGAGKFSLADAWAIYRERQAELRRGTIGDDAG